MVFRTSIEPKLGMNYRGNKTGDARYIANIVTNLMADRKQFVDLFCGGCSVTCTIPKTFKRVANDANPYLMALLKWYQAGNRFKAPITQTMFEEARTRVTKILKRSGNPVVDLTKVESLKDVAYLAWCAYIGSASGEFFGTFCGKQTGSAKDMTYYNESQLVKTATCIQNVKLSCVNYLDLKLEAPSVIYCDPPWKGLGNYALTMYNPDEFYEWCVKTKKSGHTILLSEVSAPEDLFKLVKRSGVSTSSYGLYLMK